MADIASRPTFQAEQIDDIALGQLVDHLDAVDEIPKRQQFRKWAFHALQVRAGERALDIGSGTGSETRVLAEAVTASGRAIGLDPNPGMAAVSRQRAEATNSTARFVVGDAHSLPFSDESFDIVRSETVFQHLADPSRAVTEVARVLKPGGRAMIIDSDWGTAIMHLGDSDMLQRITEEILSHSSNPYSGRLLPGQLGAAGLIVQNIETETMTQDPRSNRDPFVETLLAWGVTTRAITAVERSEVLEQLHSLARGGDFHMSVTSFAFLVQKP
ncbi:methyltransferase [Rhodococcus sp. WMMA185]|uniref:methyltransferase domain-containing protein n=1 Tax=Rhodococcus sp. WMMA185 TaxID=679318 RepID=UPI000878CAAA|nr:methyltransferase domain-containing protein [Rhodococcus sp. WMMA185]AOW93726.1 methyltransferase [Rhodococcus sp. WMMA185]